MQLTYHKCESCGSDLDISVGQTLVDNRIYWNASYLCADCDIQVEVDGSDITPEEYRKLILKNTGTWGLEVNETPSQVPAVLKILRKANSLSIEETKKIKNNIPGILAIGTRVEMLRLQTLLTENRLNATIRRVE